MQLCGARSENLVWINLIKISFAMKGGVLCLWQQGKCVFLFTNLNLQHY